MAVIREQEVVYGKPELSVPSCAKFLLFHGYSSVALLAGIYCSRNCSLVLCVTDEFTYSSYLFLIALVSSLVVLNHFMFNRIHFDFLPF